MNTHLFRNISKNLELEDIQKEKRSVAIIIDTIGFMDKYQRHTVIASKVTKNTYRALIVPIQGGT